MRQWRNDDRKRHTKLLEMLEQPNARFWRLNLSNRDQKIFARLCQLNKIFLSTEQWVRREPIIQAVLFVNNATDRLHSSANGDDEGDDEAEEEAMAFEADEEVEEAADEEVEETTDEEVDEAEEE